MSLVTVGFVEPFGALGAIHWVGASVKISVTKSTFLYRIVTCNGDCLIEAGDTKTFGFCKILKLSIKDILHKPQGRSRLIWH